MKSVAGSWLAVFQRSAAERRTPLDTGKKGVLENSSEIHTTVSNATSRTAFVCTLRITPGPYRQQLANMTSIDRVSLPTQEINAMQLSWKAPRKASHEVLREAKRMGFSMAAGQVLGLGEKKWAGTFSLRKKARHAGVQTRETACGIRGYTRISIHYEEETRRATKKKKVISGQGSQSYRAGNESILLLHAAFAFARWL